MNIPEIYYNKAIIIARRYFRFYKNTYIQNALDCNDIEQEALLVTFETLQKYSHKSEDEINKLLNIIITRKLNKIRDASANHKRIFLQNFSVETLHNINMNKICKKALKRLYKTKKYKNATYQEKQVLQTRLLNKITTVKYLSPDECPNNEFDFEDLRNNLSQQEYEIIYYKFVEDKTFREIGKILNYSHEGIRKQYNKILIKLKEIL